MGGERMEKEGIAGLARHVYDFAYVGISFQEGNVASALYGFGK